MGFSGLVIWMLKEVRRGVLRVMDCVVYYLLCVKMREFGCEDAEYCYMLIGCY